MNPDARSDAGLASGNARWGWLLLVVTCLALLPEIGGKYTPNTWLVGDGGFYLNMQKSLTQSGTLDQASVHPHSWYAGDRDVDDAFSNVSLGRNGEWWPKHSYLMPIFALPFYWLFGVLGTLLFNLTTMVGMILVGYALAKEIAPSGLAAAAALTAALCGPYVAYSYNFSNDGFYTVLAMASVLAVARERIWLAGALFGLAVWAKVTNVLLAPVLLSALLWRKQSLGQIVRFGVAAAVPVILYALGNWYMFGAPWTTSYHRVLVVKDGLVTTASHTDLFTVPFWKGLDEMLFKERIGLLTGYPLLVLSWLGLIPLIWRRETRWLGAGLLVGSVVMIGFYARFIYYQERFLFPVFTLMIIPTAAAAHWVVERSKRLSMTPRSRLITLLALGIAVASIRIGFAVRDRARYVLSDHIEDARVYLGDRHCDYFNNMRWAWECVGGDRGDGEFLGPNAGQEHKFKDKEVTGYINAFGHHTKKPRRVVWPAVPLAEKLVMRYGLDDASHATAESVIVVRISEQVMWQHTVKTKGELYEQVIDTSAFAGQAHDVVITVKSDHRQRARFIFDGWVK